MKSSSKYRDTDALAYTPGQGAPKATARFVSKKTRRQQGLEVKFDPKAHKDYLTGFRKRKNQRRKDAQQQLKDKEAKERLQTRAEKRAKLKLELGLTEDYELASGAGNKYKSGRPPKKVVSKPAKTAVEPTSHTVYKGSNIVTTVQTIPVSMDSDGDE